MPASVNMVLYTYQIKNHIRNIEMPNSTPVSDTAVLVDENTLIHGVEGNASIKSVTLGTMYSPITYHLTETPNGRRRVANSKAKVSGNVVLAYSAGYEVSFGLTLVSKDFGEILTTEQLIDVLKNQDNGGFVASVLHQDAIMNYSTHISISVTNKDFLSKLDYIPYCELDEQTAARAGVAACAIEIDEDLAVTLLSNIEWALNSDTREDGASVVTKDMVISIKQQLLALAADMLALPEQ